MRDVFFILSSVLLNCAAQLLMRRGMLNVGEVGLPGIVQHMEAMLANLWLWGAIVCFLMSVLLWMSVLSKVEVSFAYPFNSVGYVVAAVVCHYWLGESLSPVRLAGIVVICLGVYLISRS